MQPTSLPSAARGFLAFDALKIGDLMPTLEGVQYMARWWQARKSCA